MSGDPAGGALDTLGQDDPWTGVSAVVLGFGAAGFAAADNLLHLGAEVLVLAGADLPADRDQEVELLEVLGAHVHRDTGVPALLAGGTAHVVVVAPEGRALAGADAVVAAAEQAGVPVWSDAELAWRLRPGTRLGAAPPWLVVTGPDDDEVAACVDRLRAVLAADGRTAVAAGAGARPLVEVVMDPAPCDVLAVGLAASQLDGLTSMTAESAAVLGVAGAPDGFAERAGVVYAGVRIACVYVVADAGTERLVLEADVVEGARAIGVTLGTPAPGMVGVVEDLLVDRAFIAERATSAAEIGSLDDAGTQEPRRVLHALVAAALARGHGVTQQAVRDGLRASTPSA